MSGGYRIDLEWRDGRRERIQANGERSVLESAEAAGIALPFGCRTGACATCTARLLDGDLEHRRPPRALDAAHLEDGYVLPCVAIPGSDCRLEVGAAVASDLVTNPWK